MNTNDEPGSITYDSDQIRELDNREFLGLVLALPSREIIPSEYDGCVIGKDARVFAFADLRAFLIIRDNGRVWTGKVFLLRTGREITVNFAKLEFPGFLERIAKKTLIDYANRPLPPLRDRGRISARDAANLIETAIAWNQAKQEQRENPDAELFVVLVAELKRKISEFREVYGDELVGWAFAAVEGVEITSRISQAAFDSLPELPLSILPKEIPVGLTWKTGLSTEDPQKPVWLISESMGYREPDGVIAVRSIAEII